MSFTVHTVGRVPHFATVADEVRYLYRTNGLDPDLADPTDEVVMDTRKGTHSGPYVAGRGARAAELLNEYVAGNGVTNPPFKAVTVASILGS